MIIKGGSYWVGVQRGGAPKQKSGVIWLHCAMFVLVTFLCLVLHFYSASA